MPTEESISIYKPLISPVPKCQPSLVMYGLSFLEVKNRISPDILQSRFLAKFCDPIPFYAHLISSHGSIRFLGLCWLINVENWLSETVKQCKQCTINDRGSAFMAFSGLQLAFNWWFNFIRIYLKNLFFPTLLRKLGSLRTRLTYQYKEMELQWTNSKYTGNLIKSNWIWTTLVTCELEKVYIVPKENIPHGKESRM